MQYPNTDGAILFLSLKRLDTSQVPEVPTELAGYVIPRNLGISPNFGLYAPEWVDESKTGQQPKLISPAWISTRRISDRAHLLEQCRL